MKSLALALALLGLVAAPARADGSADIPSYLGSRAFTHKLNPLGGFGLVRFIGARGLLGRIRSGSVDQGFFLRTDEKSIARILTGTGMSYEAAQLRAAEVIADSRARKLDDGGKMYPVSRFFSSRVVQSIVGFVSGAGIGGLVSSAMDRAIVPRALAGRMKDGKPLLESEQRLVAAIAR